MTFVKYLRASRQAPLFMLLWQLCFFTFGVGSVVVINCWFNEDADYACMGSMMALIGTLAGVLTRGNLNGHTRFRLVVSMGQTRQSFLLFDPILTALNAALGVLIAWGLYRLELLLYAWWYPGYENGMNFGQVFRWQVLLLAILVLSLLDLFFAALLQRFGTKGFGAVWIAFCLVPMVLPQAVKAAREGGTSLFARFGAMVLAVAAALPAVAWIGLAAAVLLALTIASVLCFRRAEVRL